MAHVKATGTRVIHVGSVMLVPGMPTEVSDDMLKAPGVKELMDAKEIERVSESEAKPKAEGSAPPAGTAEKK